MTFLHLVRSQDLLLDSFYSSVASGKTIIEHYLYDDLIDVCLFMLAVIFQ